jgi:hypothetical protein
VGNNPKDIVSMIVFACAAIIALPSSYFLNAVIEAFITIGAVRRANKSPF